MSVSVCKSDTRKTWPYLPNTSTLVEQLDDESFKVKNTINSLICFILLFYMQLGASSRHENPQDQEIKKVVCLLLGSIKGWN